MDTKDNHLLQKMRAKIVTYCSSKTDIGVLAEQLLVLRDFLQLHDDVWFNELTQQIATLDSASTFESQNEDQARQVFQAVNSATTSIVNLIDKKLAK